MEILNITKKELDVIFFLGKYQRLIGEAAPDSKIMEILNITKSILK